MNAPAPRRRRLAIHPEVLKGFDATARLAHPFGGMDPDTFGGEVNAFALLACHSTPLINLRLTHIAACRDRLSGLLVEHRATGHARQSTITALVHDATALTDRMQDVGTLGRFERAVDYVFLDLPVGVVDSETLRPVRTLFTWWVLGAMHLDSNRGAELMYPWIEAVQLAD